MSNFNNKKDLKQKDDPLFETHCPRCGRKYSKPKRKLTLEELKHLSKLNRGALKRMMEENLEDG